MTSGKSACPCMASLRSPMPPISASVRRVRPSVHIHYHVACVINFLGVITFGSNCGFFGKANTRGAVGRLVEEKSIENSTHFGMHFF